MSEDKSDKWVMPEPIFRRSTGELVNPSPDVVVDSEPDTLAPNVPDEEPIDPEPDTLVPDRLALDMDEVELELPEDPLAQLYAPPEGHVKPEPPAPEPPAPETPAANAIEIEPQPFISEEFTADKVVVDTAEAKPKSSTRPIFFAIGVIALLGIAAGFIWLVYFLFFSAHADSGGF